MKALHIECGGIVCDNPKCSYENKDARLHEYKQYLNKPCPKCGENLLTQENMDTISYLIDLSNTLGDTEVGGDTRMSTMNCKVLPDGQLQILVGTGGG